MTTLITQLRDQELLKEWSSSDTIGVLGTFARAILDLQESVHSINFPLDVRAEVDFKIHSHCEAAEQTSADNFRDPQSRVRVRDELEKIIQDGQPISGVPSEMVGLIIDRLRWSAPAGEAAAYLYDVKVGEL